MAVPTMRQARYAKVAGRNIGDGSYRKVYKTPRGKWVFKVNRTDDEYGRRYGNEGEYKTYLKLKDSNILPDGVKLPEMHLLSDGTLAAEYVKGEHPKNWCSPDYHGSWGSDCDGTGDCWANKFKDGGFPVKDMHPENVIVTEDGTVYIIDLGHGTTR